MILKDTTVRARIKPKLKQDVEAIFHTMGLTTTEAIRIFLFQVKMYKGFPFPMVIPGSNEDVGDILLPSIKRKQVLDIIDGD